MRKKFRKKFNKGDFYIIKFLDHCIGDELIYCEVAGWVLKEGKESVTLTYWKTNSKDKETEDENTEPLRLIKSTIKEVKRVELVWKRKTKRCVDFQNGHLVS
jgi:hypothetical protein